MLAAQVLSRVDGGTEQLARRISFCEKDLLAWAPVARARLQEKALSVHDLCQALIVHSDNTAANLLLAAVGGPGGLTAYARSSGDPVFRLDRNEPTLNEAAPGDERDTTSPAAIVASLQRVVLGTALSPRSRSLLQGWMKDCATGKNRLRSIVPLGWPAGFKTGTGLNGTTNDLAVIWPSGRAPILMAVFSTGSPLSGSRREAVVAEVGRIVLLACQEP